MTREDRHGLYFEDDHEENAGADDDSHVQIDDEEGETEDAHRQNYQGAHEAQPVPSWPQSYRQSMDIYSHMASPGISLFSPHSNRPSHSFLSPYPSLRQRAPVSTSFDPSAHPLLSGDPLPPPGVQQPSAAKPPLPPTTLSTTLLPTTTLPPKAHSAEEDDLYYYAPPEEVREGSSFFQAMLNGVNVLAGVGVLSTPYALEQGGWGSLLLLFSFSAICCYTGLLLRHCIDAQPGLLTYPDIGWAAFGHTGRLLISACCVEFIILEGDNLEALFPGASSTIFGYHLSARHLFCLLSALCILPTVWLRDLSVLSYVSAGGVLASVTVVLAVLWVGAVDGVGFTQTGPLLRPRGLPVSVGLFGFCFSGHAVFPNIYTSMRDGRQFGRVLQFCFLLCTLIYGGMAIMGFTMFGDSIEAQITLSLPSRYQASKLAVWTTIVNPFTKYALTMTPVALCLEELLPMDPKHPSYRQASLAIRTALVASTVCVALLVPFFGYVMAFIGSFLSMTVSVILPCACFLRIMGKKATYLQTFVCSTIIIIGLLCATAGTYSSVAGIVGEFGK